MAEFSELYSLRNCIVHSGATFVTLERDAAKAADAATSLVWPCCERLLSCGLKSDEEVRGHVRDVLAKVNAGQFVRID